MSKSFLVRHKPLIKLFSVLLSLSIIFTGGTLNAFAETQKPDYSNFIVEELEEYRTEYSKTYLRNDGKLETIVSASPLHYKYFGLYTDIDNTLELDEKDGVYKNKDAPFSVELPQSTNNKKEVVVSKDGYTVSLKLVGAKGVNSKKQEKVKATKEKRKTMSAKEILNEDVVSVDKIEYSEIYDNTTIEYEVDSASLKENIILNKAPKKAVSYTYQIRAEGMQIEKRDNGSIWFYPEEDEEKLNPIFYIPIPFMYDSNDEYSYDIETNLEIKNKKATLTYTPSFEWLTDSARAYPITIDPTVTMHNGIHDGYVYSAEEKRDAILGFEDQLKVGKSAWLSECDFFETYIKFDNLPEFPENYHLTSSSIMLTPKKSCGTWSEFIVGAYEITEDWKNVYTTALDSCLTYNNRPSASTTATSHAYFDFNFSGAPEAIDVTELTKAWYSGEKDNNGVKLSMVNETNNAWDSMIYHSSRNAENAPYLSVLFEEGAEPLERIEVRLDSSEHLVGKDPNHLMDIGIYPESSRYYYINDIALTSSNENVAKIFKTNSEPPYVLYALDEGTTTVTATLTSNPQFTDTKEFTVIEPRAEDIQIMLSSNDLYGPTTVPCYIECSPEIYSELLFDDVILTSSNPEVISIGEKNYDGYFNVELLSVGTTTLTATVGDYSKSIEVTTVNTQPTAIEITSKPSNTVVELEANPSIYKVAAVLYPANASGGVVFTSSEPGVAETYCENNEWFIRVKAPGTTVITAASELCDSVTDSFTLTAVAPPIERIEVIIDASEHIIGTDPNYILDIGIYPESSRDYYIDDIVVSSSNVSVARVFKTNFYPPYVLYALNEGTTTVTATLDSNSQITDSKEFMVYYDGTSNPDSPDPSLPQPPEVIPVESYTINNLPNTMHTVFNQTHQISVAVNPNNATYPDYYFESSDPKVATIDENGLITAHKPGQTYISVKSWNYDVEAGFGVDVTGPTISYNTPENNCISVGETFTVSTDPVTTISARTPGIVRINGDGTITGLAVGKTVIEVSHPGLDYFEEFELVVTKDFVITGIPSKKQYPGYKIALGIEGENARSSLFSWYTSDNSIASFEGDNSTDYTGENVVLTCKKPGEVYVGFVFEPTGECVEYLLNISEFDFWPYIVDSESDNKDVMYVGEKRVLYINYSAIDTQLTFDYLDVLWNIPSNFDVEYINKDRIIITAISPSENLANGSQISVNIEGKEDIHTIQVLAPYLYVTKMPDSYIGIGNVYDIGILTSHRIDEIRSTNPAVATINEDGVITGVGAGYSTIVIKSNTDTKSLVLTFTINVSSVKIYNAPKNKVLFMGGKWDLDAKINNDKFTNINMQWQSSDESVATVDQNGLVTTVAPGNVTIVARLKTDHSQYAAITLTVKHTQSYVMVMPERTQMGATLKKQIADAYYGGNEQYVKDYVVTSNSEFVSIWSQMGTSCDIGYVFISAHSAGFSISGGQGGLEYDMGCEDILALPQKKVCSLLLTGCNSAHLDIENNIATALSRVVDGPVLASDGTVYPTESTGELDSRGDEIFTRISSNNAIDIPRTTDQNKGWILHKTINGNIFKWFYEEKSIFPIDIFSWSGKYYSTKKGVIL